MSAAIIPKRKIAQAAKTLADEIRTNHSEHASSFIGVGMRAEKGYLIVYLKRNNNQGIPQSWEGYMVLFCITGRLIVGKNKFAS